MRGKPRRKKTPLYVFPDPKSSYFERLLDGYLPRAREGMGTGRVEIQTAPWGRTGVPISQILRHPSAADDVLTDTFEMTHILSIGPLLIV